MMESQPPSGEFLLYETEDGRTRVECRFVEDTLADSSPDIAWPEALNVLAETIRLLTRGNKT